MKCPICGKEKRCLWKQLVEIGIYRGHPVYIDRDICEECAEKSEKEQRVVCKGTDGIPEIVDIIARVKNTGVNERNHCSDEQDK